MRVGIEAQRIFREQKHGMDFVVLETIKELQKLDTQNEYFIFVNSGPDKACLPSAPNFKVIEFSAPYAIWEQLLLRRKAKKLKLDVLHCTSNTAPIWCKLKLVVTIHDVIYYETNPLFATGYTWYQKFGNLYRRFVVKRMLPDVQKIITVSMYEKQRLSKLLALDFPRLEVIYNGVGKHFKPVKEAEALANVKAKYALPERFVLFLGNTDPKKNTEKTVLAFVAYCKAYGKTHKLVVGDLASELVKNLLQSKGLADYFDCFEFTGYIDNQDLPAVLSLADLFLYPSKRESFGIPILESMACGTPVLTGNTSAMPEIAGDSAYLVNAEEAEDITSGILKVLTDNALRDTLVQKGFLRAQAFSWTQTAKSSLNLYQLLANNA